MVLTNQRDIEILTKLSQGLIPKEIGSTVRLSPRTVENIIQALKRMNGAKNIPHLVAMALSDKTINFLTHEHRQSDGHTGC